MSTCRTMASLSGTPTGRGGRTSFGMYVLVVPLPNTLFFCVRGLYLVVSVRGPGRLVLTMGSPSTVSLLSGLAIFPSSHGQVVLPIPAEATPLSCNLTKLGVAGLDSYAEGLSAKGDPAVTPRLSATSDANFASGCTLLDGTPYRGSPDGGAVAPPPGTGAFPAAPKFLHAADVDVEGTASRHCSRFGDLLRVAASSAASSQDAVATGHQAANFQSKIPPLVSSIEIALLIVTALQGLFAAFVLLFVGPDERLRRFEATYRLWRHWAPLPSNEKVNVPRRERVVPRVVLLAVVVIIAVYALTA